MYASNYFEKMVLNTFRNVQAVAPSAVYVGLFVADPGETGEGAEITYTEYQRQKITFAEPAPMEGGIGIQNDGDITFPIAPSAAGTVTHLGVFDSQTSGNMLVYGALSSPLAVEAHEAPVIVNGEAKWYLTGDMSAHLKAGVLNLLRGKSLPGVNPYLALYTGDPDQAGEELAGENYGRLPLTFAAPQEQSGHECKIWTEGDVSTERASTNWGIWGETVIVDASSGGHPLICKAKTPSKVMRPGLLVNVASGALSVAVN